MLKKISVGAGIAVIVTVVFLMANTDESISEEIEYNASPITFESSSNLVNSNYSINSKCEIYAAWIELSKNYDNLEDINEKFVGYTSEDVGEVLGKANLKFYGKDYDFNNPPEGLAPYVDQSIYQEYVWNTSLTIFTERAMITNDINPDLKNDVRELLDLLTRMDDLESVLRQAILVC